MPGMASCATNSRFYCECLLLVVLMLHISELKQFEICSIIFIVGSSVDTATTESSTTHIGGKNNVVSKLKQQFDKRIWARFIL